MKYHELIYDYLYYRSFDFLSVVSGNKANLWEASGFLSYFETALLFVPVLNYFDIHFNWWGYFVGFGILSFLNYTYFKRRHDHILSMHIEEKRNKKILGRVSVLIVVIVPPVLLIILR